MKFLLLSTAVLKSLFRNCGRHIVFSTFYSTGSCVRKHRNVIRSIAIFVIGTGMCIVGFFTVNMTPIAYGVFTLGVSLLLLWSVMLGHMCKKFYSNYPSTDHRRSAFTDGNYPVSRHAYPTTSSSSERPNEDDLVLVTISHRVDAGRSSAYADKCPSYAECLETECPLPTYKEALQMKKMDT